MIASMDETPMVSIKWQALALPKASSRSFFKDYWDLEIIYYFFGELMCEGDNCKGFYEFVGGVAFWICGC